MRARGTPAKKRRKAARVASAGTARGLHRSMATMAASSSSAPRPDSGDDSPADAQDTPPDDTPTDPAGGNGRPSLKRVK